MQKNRLRYGGFDILTQKLWSIFPQT